MFRRNNQVDHIFSLEGFIHYRKQAIGICWRKYSRIYSGVSQPSESRYLDLGECNHCGLVGRQLKLQSSSRLGSFTPCCMCLRLTQPFEVLSDHRIHNTKEGIRKRRRIHDDLSRHILQAYLLLGALTIESQ